MLVMIAGPSGVGKNTIINELQKRNKDIKFLVSCTTRARKERDRDDQYLFIEKADFEKRIENGELFEFEKIHDNYYGTLSKTIEHVINSKGVFIKDFGVLGQRNFKEKLANKTKLLSIFLDASDEELTRRLIERGETEIQKRMSRYDYERTFKDNFDAVILNTNLEATVKKIESLIKAYQE